MIRTPFKLIGVALCLSAQATYAVPVHLATGSVGVDYDADSFTLIVDGYSIDPAQFATVVPVANGVRLEFGNYLSVTGDAGLHFTPETQMANYSALFSFVPDAGKNIAGYSITYTGSYFIELPGDVHLTGLANFDAYDSSAPFSVDVFVASAVAPTLEGQLSATGGLNIIQVFDHYENQITGYQSVYECSPDDPSVCDYHDEPIYEQVAIYHDESDLGAATITLNSITLTANVVPVPASVILFGSALTGLGGVRRLRRV